MKAAEMYCVEASDAQQNKALSKQSLSSLADGGSTHFFRLHLWVRDARRVATYILQDAGCAGHTPATHDALLHTPPR